MKEYIYSFLVGGLVTFAITYFEISGLPLLSRLAALFPVFTWISYLFIGRLDGAQAVSSHALFVLLGTIVAWMPYMLVVYYFAPKLGTDKAIVLGIVVFIILAMTFIKFYKI